MTQGQKGDNTQVFNGPPHLKNHIYSDENEVGSTENAVIVGSKLKIQILHAVDSFPWGQTVDYNNMKIVCSNPIDGKHNYGSISDPRGTAYKIWDAECDIK